MFEEKLKNTNDKTLETDKIISPTRIETYLRLNYRHRSFFPKFIYLAVVGPTFGKVFELPARALATQFKLFGNYSLANINFYSIRIFSKIFL